MVPLQSSPPPVAESDPDALLTAPEAAALLRVALSHVYAETRLGAKSALPHVRVGRFVRFRRGDLVAWVQAHTVGGTNGSAR